MRKRIPVFLAATGMVAFFPMSLSAAEEASPDKPEAPMPVPQTPEDVAAIPESAKKTESGLASRVLKEGTGEVHPTAADTVTVHYSGWTTDGRMFDSSVQRGEPTSFPLNQVITGWTEGVQQMVVGEKRRFWIPEELAYGPVVEGSGRPGGMLVFDVELLGIKEMPKPPEDALKTAGGVAYQILKEGEGASPQKDDLVSFHFLGKTMEGQTLQDSRASGAPISIPLDAPGLPAPMIENLSAMKVGETRRAWLAEPQAPGGYIVADLDMLSFKDAPEAPAVPEDVAAIPEGAETTASGLASKVLRKGGGDKKPTAADTVKVHYTGWTTDGEMFDSSVVRDDPAEFALGGVIAGWTEGLQLMSVGEKRRFWIPEELAYGPAVEGSGRPGGMLVFDVELLGIQK